MEENNLQIQSDELVVTVSECIALVNQTLDYAYPTIAVEGEVASFKVNHKNYVFFDLKDEQGSLNCFMTVWQLRIPLEDGMKVRAQASPKLTPWGKFSLTVRSVAPVGEGSLKRAYEILKAKLDKDGLFALERKRPIPDYVESIGVISSEQAAGYADFRKIMAARWPLASIRVEHSRVQGAGAADDIIAALQKLNELAEPPEIIAIVRGGGSADDLACFNDEKLVRAIAASRVPVIAGIGHETDETLSSLAADISASTPSNAAELLTPDVLDLRRHFALNRVHMDERLGGIVREQHKFITNQRDYLRTRFLNVAGAARNYVTSSRSLVKQLDPQTVLRRGYSVVRTGEKVLRDGRDVKKGQQLQIETNQAIIESEVTHVEPKN